MDKKAREAVGKIESCHDGLDLFRIAKQRVGEKKYVVRIVVLKMKLGGAKVSVNERKWKEHAEKLMNVEMNGVIALILVR